MSPAFPKVERVMGIEPTYAAWKAAILPLNYTRAPSRGNPFNLPDDQAVDKALFAVSPAGYGSPYVVSHRPSGVKRKKVNICRP